MACMTKNDIYGGVKTRGAEIGQKQSSSSEQNIDVEYVVSRGGSDTILSTLSSDKY